MDQAATAAAPIPAPNVGATRSLIETTKPGIVRLVTITSMVGFAMAAIGRPWETWPLIQVILGCLAGTALSAAGANAINQVIERDRDSLMCRTSRRPLPTQRVSPRAVLTLGIVLCIVGVVLLAVMVKPVSAIISLTCIVVYIFIYTPMKPITSFATYAGAIPGALPPLIGWTAGSASDGWRPMLELGGLSLFSLMFVWQIPHFLAIAWMYKDDYAKGGYRVLPVVDTTGKRTARTIAVWTLLLIPATLAPAWFMPRSLGPAYVCIAALTGAGFAYLVIKLLRERGRPQARAVFFGSIAHLPVLMVAMVVEGLIRVAIK